MPERLSANAIVLHTTDYGESDRVVSLFTLERGKLSAFARGARASKRRFGGALEPFTVLTAELKARPGADLWTLETVQVRRGFGGIRGDLACIACAGYASELARELIRDSEAHEELYALLERYLAALDAGPAEPTVLRAYELGALAATGLMPRFDACARCGGEPAPFEEQPEPRLRFDPTAGGVLCASCAPLAHPGSLDVRLGTAMALSVLQGGGIEAAAAAPLSREAGAEARAVLTRFVEHQLGRRLQSRKFLDEVGAALR